MRQCDIAESLNGHYDKVNGTGGFSNRDLKDLKRYVNSNREDIGDYVTDQRMANPEYGQQLSQMLDRLNDDPRGLLHAGYSGERPDYISGLKHIDFKAELRKTFVLQTKRATYRIVGVLSTIAILTTLGYLTWRTLDSLEMLFDNDISVRQVIEDLWD